MSDPEISRGFQEAVETRRAAVSWATLARGLREATRRLDGWINPYTGLGGAGDRSVGMTVGQFTPLTVETLDAMYHGEDLPATIVDALPTDALSAGFSFGDPALDDAARRWRLGDLLLEARIWSRLHGVGGLLLGTSAVTGPMNSKLRLETVGPRALQYILPIQRDEFSIAAVNMDPDSPTYRDPVMYRVGNRDVHPSRVILFPGARTSARQRAMADGFDLSVLQRPYNVLRDTEHTWRSIMAVVADLSTGVVAVKNLQSQIANGHAQVARDRADIMAYSRSVNGMLLLDADNESYQHVGAVNLTGIDPLVMRVFVRLAAAARMPVTRLLGMSPAGLNATGESDLANWYKECMGERTLLEPSILYLGALVALSEGCTVPGEVTWPALWDLSDLEQSTLDKTRAETANIRITAGISDPDEERRILAGERTEDVLSESAQSPDLPALPEAVEDAPDTERDPQAGEIWIDTHDPEKRRLQVVRVGGGKVYYVDLDAEDPGRQWRWAVDTFLRQCQVSTPAPGA